MNTSTLFGKLSLDALPHNMVQAGGAASVVLGGLAVAAALTYLKRWK